MIMKHDDSYWINDTSCNILVNKTFCMSVNNGQFVVYNVDAENDSSTVTLRSFLTLEEAQAFIDKLATLLNAM